jgi:hypothetical protein
MSDKHFVNLGEGILGEPDPNWIWADQIKSFSKSIIDDVKQGNTKIVAPCIGQASELKALKEIFKDQWTLITPQLVVMDKFICYINRTKRLYGIDTKRQNMLNLNSTDMNELHNSVWLLNPPYNDGTKANNPIYQHFVKKVSVSKPKAAIIIIQANWLMKTDNMSMEIRRNLKSIGVKTITVNPINAFPNAQVRTVSILCETGYSGDISLVDAVSKKSVIIKDFYKLVPFCFDQIKLDLLARLVPAVQMTTKKGPEQLTDTYLIATAYQNFDIAKDPVGYIRMIEPALDKKYTGYRVFAEYSTKAEAEEGLKFQRSFWHSKLITFIMKYRRTSYTLDNPQISWVPNVVIDHEFTDDELFSTFNLTKEEIDTVNEEFAHP